MTWHCLVEIRPLDTVAGSPVTIRAASANHRGVTGVGGNRWEPALVEPPAISLRLFNGDYTEAVSAGAARMALSMATLRLSHEWVERYDWAGAETVIYAGKVGDPWPWRTVFEGRVSDHRRSGGKMTLSAEVDDAPLRADALPLAYEGTGDAEGDADLAGRPKPLAIGWALNVEPVLINAVDSVYQFSGYGPIEAVTTLFERGSAFDAAAGDHADYAALTAASIAPGDWATCLAEGLVRLGAPAFGVITGDIKGHAVGATTPRLTGAIIAALADVAGVDAGLIEQGTLGAMDAAAPYPASFVRTEQGSFLDLARELALPVNHQAGVTPRGRFAVLRVDLARDPSFTLDAQGRALPLVAEASEETVSPPYARIVMGANRAWRVHTADEIAFAATLIDLGLYDAGKTYREGNIVSLADKSRWLYIATTAGAGNAPPAWPTTSNAYWQNLDPPATADNITYVDGTPIEDLKPGEAGADVTANAQVTFAPVAAIDIQATAEGETTTPLPLERTIVLTKGGSALASGVAFAIGSITAGLAATIGASDGVLSVTQADAAGEIVVEATYGGVVYSHVVPVKRSKAAAAIGGTAGSSQFVDTLLTNISSGTLAQVTDDGVQVQSDGSGEIKFTLIAQYQGSGSMAVQPRYSTDGVSWSDVGSEVVGSIATSGGAPEPGFISLNVTATGLTADTDYYVSLFARRSVGGGTLSWHDATFTAKQP